VGQSQDGKAGQKSPAVVAKMESLGQDERGRCKSLSGVCTGNQLGKKKFTVKRERDIWDKIGEIPKDR